MYHNDTQIYLGFLFNIYIKINTKMKHLKTLQELNEASENLNISDVSDSLKNILKTVKKKSKNKRWMGANVHSSAFEEGKECVLNILEDILKN